MDRIDHDCDYIGCGGLKMSRKCRKYQSLLGVILAVFSLTACGLSGGPESGKVIDASTNEPVEGAIVVARWIGHLATWAHGSTNCYHVESTTTDESGEFHIPKWKKEYTEDWQKNVRPRYVDVTVYKPDYQFSPRQLEEQSHLKGVYYIEPFKGSTEERLTYLSSVAVSCSDKTEIEINLLTLYKSLYKEAKSLAVINKEDKLKVLYRLRDLERLELGSDKAWENFRERERELK